MIDDSIFYSAAYEESNLVWLWIPFDASCSGFRGAIDSLPKIKQLNRLVESYSPYQQRTLDDLRFHIDESLSYLQYIEQTKTMVQAVMSQVGVHLGYGKKILSIGGNHSVSIGCVEAYKKKYPDLVLLHFDAHQDFRSSYHDDPFNHACPMYDIYHRLGVKTMFQFGIRSACQEEREQALGKIHTEWFDAQTLPEILKQVHGMPIYLSLDVDVFDPAYFPATGTPEPGGWHPSDFLQKIVPLLTSANLVGADVVEYAPIRDVNDHSGLMMCLLMRELTLLLQFR